MLPIFLALAMALFSFVYPNNVEKKKVGLCVMATGRYAVYAQEMIQSARPFFCTAFDVTYFVFTDGDMEPAQDVVKIYQKRLGWPHDTLKRFHVYDAHQDLLKKMDYLFAIDADMRFVAPVGEEILGDLVATLHPGFVGKRGSFERKHISTAYVEKKERRSRPYFAGGFFGGSTKEFLKLAKTAKEKIDQDEKKHRFIAVWHDESHLNRYFIDHPPTVILSPSYCYKETWELPYVKKLIALDKDHTEMRKP